LFSLFLLVFGREFCLVKKCPNPWNQTERGDKNILLELPLLSPFFYLPHSSAAEINKTGLYLTNIPRADKKLINVVKRDRLAGKEYESWLVALSKLFFRVQGWRIQAVVNKHGYKNDLS
jgi:hypothetical protein